MTSLDLELLALNVGLKLGYQEVILVGLRHLFFSSYGIAILS